MSSNQLLSTDAIIEAAEIGALAHGFVDEGLRARVDRLVAAFRDGKALTEDQQAATHRQMVKLLARRIGIAADIQRHPEILDEEVRAPIFVVGFPRTGTTIQQELLATDPANRTPLAWQTREPSPPPGAKPVTEFRLTTAADDVRRCVEKTPGIMAMHPYWDRLDQTATEDEEILTLDFRNNYPTFFYEAPSLDYMIRDEDLAGSYAFLRMFMQHQQWRLPKRRWVMKGVDHQRQLSALFAEFTDAHCLFAHRDPAEFMASNMAIGAVVYAGITNGVLDRKAQGASTLADFEDRLNTMMADPMLSDPRVTHMPFRAFIADPVGMLRQCYDEWGMEWTKAAQSAMQAWLADPANDGKRYGQSSLDMDYFGIDWSKESPRFDAYRERFLKVGKMHETAS